MAVSIIPVAPVDKNDVYARPLEWLIAGIDKKQNFFVTGRAGCGKTTLIKRFKEKCEDKNIVVLAPTALTAINSGGQTIHSFFKLHPSLFRQKHNPSKFNKLNHNKKKLIESLDVLIIDEISMVRSDVFDAIDRRLKDVRNNDLPFGGVQMILVGDLRQIAPVVTGTDHTPISKKRNNNNQGNTQIIPVDKLGVRSNQPIRLVNDFGTLGINFNGTYFFDTDAFEHGKFFFISLQHVFRQKEPEFLTLLDGIRQGDIESAIKADASIENILNSIVSKQKHEDLSQDYTILTPTNDIARHINRIQFRKLDSSVVRMNAQYEIGFSKWFALCFSSRETRRKFMRSLVKSAFNTDRVLELKVGAKIVFIQSDPQRRWINGTRGTIEKVEQATLLIRTDQTNDLLQVDRVTWTGYEHRYSWLSGKIKKVVKFRFKQFPIRLAYAVTIHKSQGLTLDKVFIEFGRGMFAHGQAYVAFSRARTLEGLRISRIPTNKDLKLDTKAIPALDKLEYLEKKKNYYSIGKFTYVDTRPKARYSTKVSAV